MENSKFIAGIVLALVLVGMGFLMFGVFEEANDGPVENTIEAIDGAIKG